MTRSVRTALRAFAPLLAIVAGACSSVPREVPILATAKIAQDFATYRIERVGLLPFQGQGVDAAQAESLQSSLGAEIKAGSPYEIVLLGQRDLEEIRAADGQRLGWYPPETIIALSQRHRLDALVFGTVVRQQQFPPQHLDLQVDLVSAETGVPVWSGSVQLDAGNKLVRDGLTCFYGGKGADSGQPGWKIALLAPSRFGRFAAWQVASLL
jgi:hypothetical protein